MPLKPVGNNEACQPLVEVLRRVEHHFDHAFHIAVGGRQRSDVHSEAARNRGANLILIKDFSFDFAGLEHVLREGLEHRFIAERKSKALHAANQSPLAMPDTGQPIGQCL